LITSDQLEQVLAWIGQHAASTDMEQQMRAAFPDCHFTFCSDDDVMSDAPAAESVGFNLYMVDSSSHCLCLTREMASASGLVVATVEED
jgi:hypothetical protein